MSNAEIRERSCVVLARKRIFSYMEIRRQPASEKKRSGIELHCGVEAAGSQQELSEAESSCIAESGRRVN